MDNSTAALLCVPFLLPAILVLIALIVRGIADWPLLRRFRCEKAGS